MTDEKRPTATKDKRALSSQLARAALAMGYDVDWSKMRATKQMGFQLLSIQMETWEWINLIGSKDGKPMLYSSTDLFRPKTSSEGEYGYDLAGASGENAYEMVLYNIKATERWTRCDFGPRADLGPCNVRFERQNTEAIVALNL